MEAVKEGINKDLNNTNPWNELIKLRDKTKSIDIKNHASKLLSQLNTSGGRAVYNEAWNFINQYK